MVNKKETVIEQVAYNLRMPVTELKVLMYLSKKVESDVEGIVVAVEKDRTTVQKILIKLAKKNLVNKRQENQDRGFKYVWYTMPKVKEYLVEVSNNQNAETIKLIGEL